MIKISILYSKPFLKRLYLIYKKLKISAGDDAKVLLECDNIRKKYGKKEVLKGAGLTVRSGELAGLTGENGSGKSTLLRCILNLDRSYLGKVHIAGSTGYCPQENYLRLQYTVKEHMDLMAAIVAGGKQGRKQKAVFPGEPGFIDELFENFKLTGYKKTLIGCLSSGTYQKLKFITALISNPDLIILDEPYDGFDWDMYLLFWQVIDGLKARGSGVLLVSHFIHDFERFDIIYKLNEGKIAHAR